MQVEPRLPVVCYAEGRGAEWEAFCLTFNFAVQGVSFEDVRDTLKDQITLYIEDVATMQPLDARRFLRRRAPLRLWLSVFSRLVFHTLVRRDDRERHEYSYPLGRLVAPI